MHPPLLAAASGGSSRNAEVGWHLGLREGGWYAPGPRAAGNEQGPTGKLQATAPSMQFALNEELAVQHPMQHPKCTTKLHTVSALLPTHESSSALSPAPPLPPTGSATEVWCPPITRAERGLGSVQPGQSLYAVILPLRKARPCLPASSFLAFLPWIVRSKHAWHQQGYASQPRSPGQPGHTPAFRMPCTVQLPAHKRPCVTFVAAPTASTGRQAGAKTAN